MAQNRDDPTDTPVELDEETVADLEDDDGPSGGMRTVMTGSPGCETADIHTACHNMTCWYGCR